MNVFRLVFSQSLFTLDIIEYFLNKIDDNSQKSDPDPNLSQFGGSWAKGLDYFRMDGGSSFDHRHAWCKAFNNERNSRYGQKETYFFVFTFS